MKKDKARLYILEVFIVLFLFIILFTTTLFENKVIMALILLIAAVLTKKLVNNHKSFSIHEKEASKYMIIFAILYIVIYYIIGYYAGYYNAYYKFNLWTIINKILPFSIIIISSEIIRREFLIDKSKFSIVITFIFGVLIDLIIYETIYDFTTLNSFLEGVGYVIFPSIASNILYNYVSINFGIKPNIYYRLITIIYLYIIPITPDVYIYFRCFARIIYPILIYFALEDAYEKRTFLIKNSKIRRIITVVTVISIILFTMLISCKFTYGMIVIGSGSMTGSLDIGDAIVFKSKFKENDINNGEIIVFRKNDIMIVHRVIRIVEINDEEKRFYTKGDNNIQEDTGYITKDDIIGKVKFKVIKIGLPTVWINELFKNI